MPTECTKSGTINAGDAVCVIDFDTIHSRPTVARATAANLVTSKTVFGVATNITTVAVRVFVAGEVVGESVTGLGAGPSRIIATDIKNGTVASQCRLVRIERPDGSEHVAGTCDENGNLVIQPRASRSTSALHVYNPRSYGAIFDGVTDDLAALQAMHNAIPASGGIIAIPPGMAWLSDTWHISKPVQMRGVGGNAQSNSGFEVAPGKTALSVDSGTVAPDKHNATQHIIQHLDLKSRILVHGTAFGSTLGLGIDNTFSGGATVRKGDCYIKLANAAPTRFYRAQNAGTFGNAEPAWSTTTGSITVDHNITWVTEAFPAVRQSGTPYGIGDRVYAVDDNRYLFECTVKGTSAGSPPLQMLGGDRAGGVKIGSTFTDGDVTWITKVAAGMYINTNMGTVGHIYGEGFTGAVVHLQGGSGQDAAGMTTVDNFTLHDIVTKLSGLGVYVGGSDANAWVINALFGQLLGWLQPRPDAKGAGGHLLHDRSDAGGRVSDLSAQTSTGRAVLKNGNGVTTFLSCYQELPVDCHFEGGPSTVIGGSLRPDATSASVIHLSQTIGRGIAETDSHPPRPALYAQLLAQDGISAFPFYSDDENKNTWSWKYGYGLPKGWWGLGYGNQGLKYPFALSSTAAGFDPSPGWITYPLGIMYGDPMHDVPVIEGTMMALTSSRLRNGRRRRGDRFGDGNRTYVLTGDGYRGQPWTASTVRAAKNLMWTIPGDIIEPIANGPNPAAGLKVFECTTSGKSGLTEPNWAAAVVPGDTVNDPAPPVPGGVVWTLLGTTPSWIGEGRNASAAVGADYALDRFDAHVTFTAGGKAATLPASPWDGEAHEIKSGGAFTTAINGNGKTIDGSATYTQSNNRACTKVRYSAAADQWEIV
jgi:hypothetical protein